MTIEEKAQKYTIDNVCGNCNKCQSKGYIGCDTFRFAKKAYLDRAKKEIFDPFGNKVDLITREYVESLEKQNAEMKNIISEYYDLVEEMLMFKKRDTEKAVKIMVKAEKIIKE